VGYRVVIGEYPTLLEILNLAFLSKLTCLLTLSSKNFQILRIFDPAFDAWKYDKSSKIGDLHIFQTNLTNARFCYNETAKIGDFCIFCPTNPHIA